MQLRPVASLPKPPGRLSNLFHNVALIACALQVSIVYWVAGLAKATGKYWQNGTAFYYVLRSGEFGVTNLGPWLWNRPLLIAALTWAPVLMQISFPWVCFFGKPMVRRLLIASAIGFHLGIFFLMGLETFALFMIAGELLLLSDDDYDWMFGLARAVERQGRAWLSPLVPRRLAARIPSGGKVGAA
jgi:hypothetical protein